MPKLDLVSKEQATLEGVISLTDAKNFLRIFGDDEDELIQSLIFAAQGNMANYINEPLMSTRLVFKFKAKDNLLIPFGNANIESVEIGGINSSADFTLSNFVKGTKVSYQGINGNEEATITFTTGYNLTVDVPEALKLIARFMVSHYYDNRADSKKQFPNISEYLLEPYRNYQQIFIVDEI